LIDGLLTVAQRAQLKDVFLNECGCETTTGKETGRLRLSGGMLESSYNFDSIHYQFIYSLLELIRDIHQTRAYVTMERSNVLPRPEPRAKSQNRVR